MSTVHERWAQAISHFHGDRKGIAHDEEKAFKIFLELATKENHAPSQLELGCCYMLGQGTEKNFAEAKKWWMKLKSDPEAQYGLGLLYYIGENGIKKDDQKAIYYWKKAAANNNFNAIHKLAQCFPNYSSDDGRTPVGTPVAFSDSEFSFSDSLDLKNFIQDDGLLGSPQKGGVPVSPVSPVTPVSRRNLHRSLTMTKTQRRGSLIGEINLINSINQNKKKPILTVEVPSPSHLTQHQGSRNDSDDLIDHKKTHSELKRIMNNVGFLKQQNYDLHTAFLVGSANQTELKEQIVDIQQRVEKIEENQQNIQKQLSQILQLLQS